MAEIMLGKVVKRHSPAYLSGESASSISDQLRSSGMGDSGGSVTSATQTEDDKSPLSMLDYGKGSRDNQKKIQAMLEEGQARGRALMDE